MHAFQYVAPTSLAAARELLKDAISVPTRVLAGGTDLLVQMRAGLHSPARLLDIKKIPETNVLCVEAGQARIGAAVCAARIGEHDALRRLCPGVAEAIALIGSVQVQGRATVVGNLCNASPAADSVPALMAAGASIRVIGPDRERWLPVAGFAVAPGRTLLAPDELIVELRLPVPDAHTAEAYQRFTPRAEMDIAVVGVGARLTLDRDGCCRAAEVAIGAVAPTALPAPEVAAAILGARIDEAALTRAAAAAKSVGNPISDKRGTADFRRHIAGVLTRRVLRTAAERARQRSL
ncbi:MAG: carbon monoxide dehydrogenase [Betaproteobacteria bacterium]|nr:xanthine dehydrogenase family protein subunit M [Rhodocyclaceae bacterium]